MRPQRLARGAGPDLPQAADPCRSTFTHPRMESFMDTNAPDAAPALDAAVRAVGRADGHNPAAWWIQHTIGGRASGDLHALARRILAGIDDGDPTILAALPAPTP